MRSIASPCIFSVSKVRAPKPVAMTTSVGAIIDPALHDSLN